MNNYIEFEKGFFGTKAIIKGDWEHSFLEIIADNDIRELELNSSKGWSGDSIDFIKFFPKLQSLILIDFKIKSVDTLHSLKNLVKIQLSTYAKTPVNFELFPQLVDCGFEWIKGSDSLFECKGLKSLGLNRYDGNTSSDFSKLKSLQKLTLLNSSIRDIDGLNSLVNLRYLSLVNLKNVKLINGIKNLKKMEELEIQKCKGIVNISEFFELHKLKSLLLIDSGNIESIKGIERLTQLENFLFYESTNVVDGDISGILKLKNLKKISFQNRKHYSHKREDFGKLYSSQK